MAKRVLTDKAVTTLKAAPAGQRYIMSDAVVPGLGVRVTDRGHRTYVLGARYPGSPHFKRRELGEVGAITLAAVRDKAREWLVMIKAGTDPAVAERRARDAARVAQGNTFGAVAQAYLDRATRGQRKAARIARDVRKELLPAWGDRPIGDITRRDVVELVEKIADRGTTGAHAHSILSIARRIFNWAIARGAYGIEHAPTDHLRPAEILGPRRVRDRVLTDAELRALWEAASELGYPLAAVTRMLALTGARLGEALLARWGEFDLGARLWTIPSERFKAGQQHLVPIGDDLLVLLGDLPRFNSCDCLFTTRERKPPTGFHTEAKAKLDAEMRKRLGGELPPWTIHDIRRTVRTRLSQLRIPEHVAEMVIGHSRRGMARIYDQHRYLEEVAEALAAWANLLRSIIEGRPANVVVLRR